MGSQLGMVFIPGGLSEDILDGLIREAAALGTPGERIELISRRFLGTPYRQGTLIGDLHTPEVFVINLREMDCLTFLEYVEAMRRSASFREFQDNLLRVRYRSGVPEFRERNHFFTDWRDSEGGFIRDVTQELGQAVRTVKKDLNRKADGSRYLPGIRPPERTVRYLPSAALKGAQGLIRTGDYIGIYSAEPGLDVSHTGIAVRAKDTLMLRHASSRQRYRRVVDEPLATYLKGKPGIVVLRPQ
jgi:hypothetical protein